MPGASRDHGPGARRQLKRNPGFRNFFRSTLSGVVKSLMLVALFEPEIPPNTGNVARLCAAFGVELHLIEPLGFKLENRYLKRAGLDYWPHVRLVIHPCWDAFRNALATDARLVLCTTKGSYRVHKFEFHGDDVLVLGPETRGLPDDILAQSPWHVRIPTIGMENGGVRSLNLSTAAGILLYAALASSGSMEFI